MVRRFFPAVGAMLALAWIGASVYAQTSVDLSSTGFKGEVKQIQQGGVGIGGATVQYTGPTVTDSVVTDAAGNFEVVNIEPGPYVLSITAEGYKPRESQTVTVVQGAVSPMDLKMREKTTLVTFAGRFGWVGIPLLLCSVGAVTFIIERLLVYAKLNSGTTELLQRISDALSQGNAMDAIQACEEAATPIANVLKGGLLRYSQGLAGDGAPGKGAIQEAMAEGATLELPEFERNLTWLSMIAVVSPLFGLLGTVLGMIKAFTVIALEGTNDPNALAGGISEALYTTAAGLSIAAPALVFYAIFENIVNTNTIRIEIAATDTVNALVTDGSSS
jgi:biopolymer transport protein ExbB